MDAQNNQSQNSSSKKSLSDAIASKVSTNPELGIKRVRTFADDLREAKEKAGIKEEQVPTKRGLFGNRKKKIKREKVKTLSEKIQPEVQPQKTQTKEPTQPSKEYIEQELAKSGILSESSNPPPKKEKTSIPAIRTYKYDAAKSIQDNNISRVSIAAAEQNKRVREKDFSSSHRQEETPIGKNILYLLLSVILVGSGIWGGVYFFNKSKISPEDVVRPNQSVILFTNNEERLPVEKLEGQELSSLLNTERAKVPNNPTTIKEIVLIEDTVFGEREISANSFLNRFANVPGSLVRVFSDDFLFGIHGGNPASPLFVFKTENFDTTFAGMLDWESTMSSDLAPLFGEPISGKFEDVILRNKDTRILKNQNNKTSIIYGFPNTKTLLITTNEETFFEIFERLTASNATRN